ncbi:MAG: DUF2934 domain-containing protein [Verrucomicrobia bacterium]|nr:DUF2934 domain-containing protein [Verrucomicrobiota bacterium]
MRITYQEISQRAYEIWEREGKPEGCEQEHWLRAEHELRENGMKEQKGRKITSKDQAMMKSSKRKMADARS